jgi:hypothetical protein
MMSPDSGNIRDWCKALFMSRNVDGPAASATQIVI